MIRERWDLVAAMGLALPGVAVAYAGWNQQWLAFFGALLVLVLPGYTLSAALLPALGGTDRLLCTLGLSLTVAVLGGILLSATPWGLHPTAWAVWLAGITLSAGLVALRAGGTSTSMAPVLSRPPIRSVAGFGLALAITALAVATARWDGAAGGEPFTLLWAVPVRSNQTYSIHVGVKNEEGKEEVYRLSLQSSGQRLREWNQVSIGPGEEWTATLDLTALPTDPIFVLLYREEDSSMLYRWAEVSPNSFSP